MPDYLPENGDPIWWHYGAWPPPLHQPFRLVVSAADAIIREAQQCVALVGVPHRSDQRELLSQMDEIAHHVSGYRFQTALRKLRELG